MRPTSRELLEAIAAALEREVAPAVEDKWAASVLRSAVQLLGHLGARVEEEARVLTEDNDDARRLLQELAPRIAGGDPGTATLRAAVTEALGPDDPPCWDTRGLAVRNDSYQAAIELLVRHRGLVAELTPGGTGEIIHAYLQRRLAREHHLYFPSFTGPPF
jgi:hypothetical protein